MKEIYVRDFEVNDEVQDFFMIKNPIVKVGSNKKEYFDFILGDNTGEISGKQWDITEEESKKYTTSIKDKELVKIKGIITEWNGSKQIKITKLRISIPNDNLTKMDYVRAAPEDPKDMYKYISEKVSAMKDKQLVEICMYFLEKYEERLAYYPAATKNHHAIFAGLLYHKKRMIESGMLLCNVYKNINKDMLLAGIVLHDMEKINEIDSDEYGMASDYTFEGKMLGHIVLGSVEVDKIGDELGVDHEKIVMLQHMILSHHYEPEFGSPKKPLFPEAELLHYLDMIDAKMYDMENALDNIEPGLFSDKVWTLENRRLYKAKGVRQ